MAGPGASLGSVKFNGLAMSEKPATDFFVSYNKTDKAWAEWIAWELEDAGYRVLLQAWDFKGNFVLEMDRAHKQALRTLAVLSPHYVDALYPQPEWAARFAQEPTGKDDRLIPIRVRKVELEGLLAQIIYTDLVDLDEDEARDRLLKRARGDRLKPMRKPSFPGNRTITEKPAFPKVAVPSIDRVTYAAQARRVYDVLDVTALARPGRLTQKRRDRGCRGCSCRRMHAARDHRRACRGTI